MRKINPDNHIHRLRFKWTLQDKCELELEVNIYQKKRILKRKLVFLYSSIHLCTRLAYLYHVTIECSVSRYYDMIWNHTAVATSLFTVFPCKDFFHSHHCFSKYIADEKRIAAHNSLHYRDIISFIILLKFFLLHFLIFKIGISVAT